MTRTLHVTIGAADGRDDIEETLDSIDDGESVDPRDPTLVIEDLEAFGQVFRSTNLAVLEAVVRHDPASIRELADVLDRHPPDVLANVRELADYGLLELERDGRAKRPVVWYDAIDVDIPLGDRSADPVQA